MTPADLLGAYIRIRATGVVTSEIHGRVVRVDRVGDWFAATRGQTVPAYFFAYPLDRDIETFVLNGEFDLATEEDFLLDQLTH